MDMWFMEAQSMCAKVVVFSEDIKNEYLAAGYEVTSRYKIQLVEGSDYLPDYVGDD